MPEGKTNPAMLRNHTRSWHKQRMSSSRQVIAGVGVASILGVGCASTGGRSSGGNSGPPNALLQKWSGPFGGVPAFGDYRLEQFEPALQEAMRLQLEEVERIARVDAPPSFDNTIAALERSGQVFDRVSTIFGIYSSSLSSPAFQAIEQKMAPRLAAFSDQITGHTALFARIRTVYETRKTRDLTPEQQRLTWLLYQRFVRSGAELPETQKATLSALNQRLATLYTTFSQNILADENNHFTLIRDEADLAGLSPGFREAAAALAAERGHAGAWAIANTRSAMEPFLTDAENRQLRQIVWQTYYSRGDNGDDRDNKPIIAEILKLRAQRAALLGYETHAHWSIENQMAQKPQKALALLEEVWKPARARALQEVEQMQAVANSRGDNITIKPWDYRHYMEKVRQEQFDLDTAELKPYLALNQLKNGLFFVARKLFGLHFEPAPEVPTFHADAEVWNVTRDGKHVGLWYFDPYARAGKQSGAWMSAYRDQHNMQGHVSTLVSNNSNFIKPPPGQPTLISWDDAQTLFHEFGHALHGLNSNVTYPSLSGTSVARDYVEFPSQLLEHWLPTDEILSQFARHHETGAPIPEALVRKIRETSTFNQGFATVEYLASAIVDLRLHLAGDAEIDPKAFERAILREIGMPTQIVMRHRTPQFSHIFSGEGYAAGYYAYLWADTLTADAFEAFAQAGGPFDPEVADRLYKHVFSVGNSVDPAEGYRAFRGKDPSSAALMRKRGFTAH